MAAQSWLVLAVFLTVYAGMILGGLPRLQLDRTGVALLGAIVIVAAGVLSPAQAAAAVHLPTLVLLFAFMVISAQMRLGGFYGALTRRITGMNTSPEGLLALVIGVVAGLSAVFSNDIVCLAVAPVLARACMARRLDPVPYLLALACAANIGSAATLIGNPQNMLIGEVLNLGFGAYSAQVLGPVVLGLAVLWWLLRRELQPLATAAAAPAEVQTPALDRWQAAKGLLVAGVLVGVFLHGGWPRDVAALTGAGILLLSRRFHSSKVMGLIDWELLVLFVGLFVVNEALAHTGLAAQGLAWLQSQGLNLSETAALFAATLVLSNLVSNVPAVMLLLPAAEGPQAGVTLALVSTLAGNLFIVGSIANIIVVDAARRQGIQIDWRRHARTGVPVTLATLALGAAWLAWRAP